MTKVTATFDQGELMYAGPFGARALLRSKGLKLQPSVALTMPRFDELATPWRVTCHDPDREHVGRWFEVEQGEDPIVRYKDGSVVI